MTTPIAAFAPTLSPPVAASVVLVADEPAEDVPELEVGRLGEMDRLDAGTASDELVGLMRKPGTVGFVSNAAMSEGCHRTCIMGQLLEAR